MDNSVNGVLQSLMEQYQARMNPQEYNRQVQGRNALIDEYEQGVRNAPPGMSQFQMGISNWLGAGGTGPNDIVRGFGLAPVQYAKQQQAEHENRQAGILKTANLRDAIAKEEDAALKAQIGLLSKKVSADADVSKLTLQQQVALRTAINQAAEGIRKANPNLPNAEVLGQAIDQVAVHTGFDKDQILNKVYGREVKAPAADSGIPEITPIGAETTSPQVVSDYVGNKPSTPKDFPGVTADVQAARDTDRLAILKDEYARVKQVADKLGNDVSNPEVGRALQDMARLKKEMDGIKTTSQPATSVAAPSVVPTKQPTPGYSTNQTALEQGYTADFLNQSKESPFAVGLPNQPILTRNLPKDELKQVNDQREAYLKGPEVKGLEEQSAGAKELRKYVQNAIDNPAKTGALAPLVNTFNSYAKAAGIPLSEDAEKQLREYAKLNQTEKAIGLMGQLMQRGVQTDKDFTRIIQSSFDTSLSPEQRRVVMRQYLDNLNKTINKQQFLSDYVAHPYSKGQERNWENSYNKMLDAGMPESVYMPNKKVVPYREAAESFWGSDVGKEFKPSKSDSPEELQRKITRTIGVLKKNDARMRDKLKTGAE